MLVLGLGMLAMLVFSACSRSGSQNGNSNASSSSSTKTARVQKGNSNNKTLIVYFSLSGTTKSAAQYIQRQTGADMVRIRPTKAYGNYDSAVKRGERELRNNIHPALVTRIPNFSKYNTVLIGYPTWWQRPPMLIHTLFDKYNFSGKTVIPFTTSMSTPLGLSAKIIRQLAQDDGATYKQGIRYDNNNSKVRSWLSGLGLEK